MPCFVVTLVINLWSAFMVPNFVTSGFSWPAFLMCLPPILWGAFLLFLYRAVGERLVSYIAIVGALFWLLPAFAMLVEV